MIIRCAEVDSTILILGETGVGKEVAARAIHAQSSRKDRPFVAINCGAFPEALLESELFGHVKGAFTGAINNNTGLFREAEGGTLLLDEIGDLTATMQVKLLRALQEKEIRPVGSSKTYAVEARVIAATNRSLEELVHQGRFRHDLYYRISVIPFVIPPLRDRREDILPLSEHFIRKHRKRATRSPITLDHTSQQLLLDYSWPGNVRELENAIEHCLAMRRGPLLTPDFLPVQIVENRRPSDYRIQPDNMLFELNNKRPISNPPRPNTAMKLSTSEKEAISNALLLHNGNQTLAARDLGISRTTIWRKIRKYRLSG
jgi:transcriptional regulator with PAS, ATPase and Fis domain